MRIRLNVSISMLMLATTSSSRFLLCQAAYRPALSTTRTTTTTTKITIPSAFRKSLTTTTTTTARTALPLFSSSSSPFQRHINNNNNNNKLSPLTSRKSPFSLSSSAIKESNSPSSSSTTATTTVASTASTTTTTSATTSSTMASSAPTLLLLSEVVPFKKPEERIIRETSLPVVYVYDHCPFCVRVRFALGLKNVKHRLVFLANDDAETPTQLVGKKISPILQWTEANIVMAESMDIIQLLDNDERLGPVQVILPATGRTDLSAWQNSVRDLLRGLQRPRYVATGLLPEFQQLDGRHAFVKNHPMPPYGSDEWKAMDMTEKLAIYAEGMAKDPATDIEELNRKLVELDDIIYCEYHCSPGGLSYDDIDLFSRLRSITIIKDVKWPAKLRKYMDLMAELADVPLYDEMAL